MTLAALASLGRQGLIVFVTPCHACADRRPESGHWQREHATVMTIAVSSQGDFEVNRTKLEPHGIVHVLVERAPELATAYGLNGRPTAKVVRPDPTIGSPLGEKPEGIRRLVQRTIAASAPEMSTANGRAALVMDGRWN